jgi:xylose isomerase
MAQFILLDDSAAILATVAAGDTLRSLRHSLKSADSMQERSGLSTPGATMSEHPPKATFAQFASRLNSFRGGTPPRSVLDALRLLASVPGITATELNYPQHFAGPQDLTLLTAAATLNLNVTALNLRYDPPHYVRGSLTNPDPSIRAKAIDLAMQAVEIAGQHDIGHVILWLGPDGYDYPFQSDYGQLWQWAVDGVQAVSNHDSQVRVSIEPKPSDPRRQSLVRTLSDGLLLASDCGAPNVGVTLDLCHALMTGETPAMAAALALRQNRLFGLHLNDGYGPADDGLAVGSVHMAQTLELLSVLKAAAWAGTIYFDTFPGHADPVIECAANIETVRWLEEALDRIDPELIREIQAGQDGLRAAELTRQALMP